MKPGLTAMLGPTGCHAGHSIRQGHLECGCDCQVEQLVVGTEAGCCAEDVSSRTGASGERMCSFVLGGPGGGWRQAAL